jgi:CheY-like chemotaxis protein
MILLVEDNKMNQLVGSKVLAKLGFEFDIANHGREALEAVSVRDYDAILMDCQMPELDGYEATAEIRRLEGAARHTPVIAMTAAAMEGDRDRCLAAGMDDYITKPVRLEAIAEVLDRWVDRPAREESAQAIPTDVDDERATVALDPAQIELLRSLDDGDGEVLGEIIDQYLHQTAEGRGELARFVMERDTKGVERTAHALRGASANIGAVALAAVCEEMESRSRSARLDGTDQLVTQFDSEFSRVIEALNDLLVPSS